MVRRLKTDGWKALPLLVVAVGGLLWHLLACVESPMAFAPNGDLAFTTMDPYDGKDDLALCGSRTYRLMVLPAGATEPKVLEEASHWVISAPAYSSDGQRLAYLRIPLLTPEELSGVEAALAARREAAKEATSRPAGPKGPEAAVWPVGPELKVLLEAGAAAVVASASPKDLTLPNMDSLRASYEAAMASPLVPAQLVERRASDGQVLSLTWVRIPLALGTDADKGGIARGLLLAYILGGPRYSPDAQWVYFCPGGLDIGTVVVGVNPSAQTQCMMGTGAVAAALSPDGKRIATLQKGCLGFLRTDGSAASYVRCETEISSAGLVWADKDTLAVLRADKIADKPVRSLSFVKTDGTIAKTVALPEMETADESDTGQLALSPDGRYVVVAFQKATYFLDSRGTLLTFWTGGDKQMLAWPTFTPDGKKVAFKVLTKGEGDVARVTAIAFFSPAGQEMHRVNLLLPPLPQTQPAVTTAPAETPGPKLEPILELPPLRVEPPPALTVPPPSEPATRPTPASAPAVNLNPDQKKAIDELTPELP